jgi:glycosyltransferase involved in cell wall biosynthesis
MKICFVSAHAYGLFDAASRETFGGAEVRARLFGEALSRSPGFEVSFIVMHDKPVERERFGAIDVWREKRRTLGDRIADRILPALRINGYRGSHARARSLRAADADVYAVFGASSYAAEIIASSHARGKKVALFLSSLYDLSAAYRPDSREHNAYGSRHDLCHYSLMQADLVLAQTEEQRELLRSRFGRASLLIPSPLEPQPIAAIAGPAERKHVLWLGKADAVKQPEPLLRLAAAAPQRKFVVVMNRSDPKCFAAAMQAKPANVQVREFVPYEEGEVLFRAARVLVNTSVIEGFPNTFLQAGNHGVPVLSLNVDPDGFLEKKGCGLCARGDFDAFLRGLTKLHDDDAAWHGYSRRIAERVRADHDLAALSARLKQALMEIA